MTKIKGEILLEKRPYEIIKWFTNNFEDEIGAFGLGEVKDGSIVVDKLVFTDQQVSGASVHVHQDMWSPVVKELTMEELSKVIFYWHSHPGSPSASPRDEEDTFDALMDPDQGRKIMGFLQTSKTYSGDLKTEVRIEISDPVRASIEAEIKPKGSNAIEKYCRKIIKERIKDDEAEEEESDNSALGVHYHCNKYQKQAQDFVDNNVYESRTALTDDIKDHLVATYHKGKIEIEYGEDVSSLITKKLKEWSDLISGTSDTPYIVIGKGVRKAVLSPKEDKGKSFKGLKKTISKMMNSYDKYLEQKKKIEANAKKIAK